MGEPPAKSSATSLPWECDDSEIVLPEGYDTVEATKKDSWVLVHVKSLSRPVEISVYNICRLAHAHRNPEDLVMSGCEQMPAFQTFPGRSNTLQKELDPLKRVATQKKELDLDPLKWFMCCLTHWNFDFPFHDSGRPPYPYLSTRLDDMYAALTAPADIAHMHVTAGIARAYEHSPLLRVTRVVSIQTGFYSSK